MSFSFSAAAEAYLCTSKKTVGLFYNKELNKRTALILESDFQLVLKPLLDSDKKKADDLYGFYTVPDGELIVRCEYWFPEVGQAHCTDNFRNIRFSRNSLTSEGIRKGDSRFIAINLAPLFFSDRAAEKMSSEATPSIRMGRCIKID